MSETRKDIVGLQEKLLWRAYIGNRQRSFERNHPRPLRPPLPKIEGSQPSAKTPVAIISGTGEATDFKYGPNIHRVHPNKIPLYILEKRERRRIQGLPIFWYPQLSQERVKLRTSNFVHILIASIGKEVPI